MTLRKPSKNPPRIGYLLGAGFSKCFGLPLANEFVDMAAIIIKEKSYRYAPSRKPDSLQKIIGFSEQNKGVKNIEELLELADKRNRIALSLNDPWLNIGNEIRKAIFEILHITQFLIFESSNGYKILDYYLRFLDLVEKTGCGPIVSLNYDCLFEIMLDTAKLSNGKLSNECAARIKFNYEIGETFRALELPGPVAEMPFFKLHGAYNWQICNKHGFQECSGPLRLSVKETCSECQAKTEPYIIYPEKRKQLTAELNNLWTKASQSLKKVDKLVVIGVQFNPADQDLLKMVQEVVDCGVEIIIINPCAVELSQNLFKKSIPIITEDKCGAKFEDVFGFKSLLAREEFEKSIETNIRDLNNFDKERPSPPFFSEPIQL